jgi:hypothetical protein
MGLPPYLISVCSQIRDPRKADREDRSNNVGILLARLRLPPARIRAAVWEVDEAVLDVDQLAMVSRMLPTHDEVCRIVKQQLIPGGKAEELRWRSYKTS